MPSRDVVRCARCRSAVIGLDSRCRHFRLVVLSYLLHRERDSRPDREGRYNGEMGQGLTELRGI